MALQSLSVLTLAVTGRHYTAEWPHAETCSTALPLLSRLLTSSFYCIVMTLEDGVLYEKL